ncbi:MAG: ribosome maturation factor RimM [Rhodospirillaceae bacterium]
MAVGSKVCVGEIAGAHGIRGLVRLRSFTEDPAAVTAYGPLEDERGRRFVVRLLSAAKDGWLASVEGVTDRTGAEALRRTKLYVERSVLPPPDEEEFYHVDLIGLRAELADGRGVLGTVTAVHDFGGGPVIEVLSAEGQSMTLPFTLAVVPVVDIAGGRLVVDPPVEIEW